MSQEAPPAVDDGSDDGHGESDGRGGTHESRGQADGEERPRLRKEDGGSEVRVFGFKLPGRRETCQLIMLKESHFSRGVARSRRNLLSHFTVARSYK